MYFSDYDKYVETHEFVVSLKIKDFLILFFCLFWLGEQKWNRKRTVKSHRFGLSDPNFLIIFQYILARRAKCTEIWSGKVPNLSYLEPNLTYLTQQIPLCSPRHDRNGQFNAEFKIINTPFTWRTEPSLSTWHFIYKSSHFVSVKK